MRGTWLTFALMLGVPVVVCGFQGAAGMTVFGGQAYSQQNVPHRTITGTVINSVSGEPVRRALVQMLGAMPRQMSVLTGADGRFQIDDVPEGIVGIYSQKPGFFDSRSIPGSEGNQAQVMFKVGSGTNDFRLTLVPAASIVGHIVDKDGEPIEGTSVMVLAEQILQGRKQWQQRGGAGTDDEGVFRAEDLMPGRYIIFCSGHAGPQSLHGPREVTAPVYYPNANDISAAQVIELRPGEEFRADLHPPEEQGFNITGTVAGVPGSLGASFFLQNANGHAIQVSGMRFDQTRGQFSAQAVPSGRWTLVFSTNDGQGHQYQARQEVAVNHADVGNLQIVMHPLASISINVSHAAVAGQQLTPRGGPIAKIIPQGPLSQQQYWAQMQGDPPVAQFTNVEAGKYQLDVPANGGECIESAWQGSINLLQDYLVVSEEGETQSITINLRSDCATLSVKQRAGGDHANSGYIVIVPDNAMGEPLVSAISRATQPQMLSPGSYQVFAFSSLAGLEYTNREALRGYPNQRVSLGAGQKTDLTVELIERKGN